MKSRARITGLLAFIILALFQFSACSGTPSTFNKVTISPSGTIFIGQGGTIPLITATVLNDTKLNGGVTFTLLPVGDGHADADNDDDGELYGASGGGGGNDCDDYGYVGGFSESISDVESEDRTAACDHDDFAADGDIECCVQRADHGDGRSAAAEMDFDDGDAADGIVVGIEHDRYGEHYRARPRWREHKRSP